jgi:hypothetical protein
MGMNLSFEIVINVRLGAYQSVRELIIDVVFLE